MIKIISPGKLKRYRISCHNCDCVFEFDERDINNDWRVSTNDAGDIERYTTVDCPFCEHKVKVMSDIATYYKEVDQHA